MDLFWLGCLHLLGWPAKTRISLLALLSPVSSSASFFFPPSMLML
jgi:hypothetical protein